MNDPMMTPTVLVFSARIYQVLLVLYPAEYRAEYSRLMVQVFEDMCRDCYRKRGMTGVVIWWLTTILDLTLTVIEQWRKVRFEMSKSMLIQNTGVLLIIGGICGAVAAFSQLQPGDHYTYYGVFQTMIWFFAPAFLLMGLGCIGLGLRYREGMGLVGFGMLSLSGLGLIGMCIGVIASQINNNLWDVWFWAGIVHVVGLTLFGVLHLWKPILPVFRGLPLQIAAGWLIMWSGVLRTSSQSTNNLLSFLIVLGVGLAWLAIGLVIHRQQRGLVEAMA